jgi:hypothetical protein
MTRQANYKKIHPTPYQLGHQIGGDGAKFIANSYNNYIIK